MIILPPCTEACKEYAVRMTIKNYNNTVKMWEELVAREERRNAKTVAPRRVR